MVISIIEKFRLLYTVLAVSRAFGGVSEKPFLHNRRSTARPRKAPGGGSAQKSKFLSLSVSQAGFLHPRFASGAQRSARAVRERHNLASGGQRSAAAVLVVRHERHNHASGGQRSAAAVPTPPSPLLRFPTLLPEITPQPGARRPLAGRASARNGKTTLSQRAGEAHRRELRAAGAFPFRSFARVAPRGDGGPPDAPCLFQRERHPHGHMIRVREPVVEHAVVGHLDVIRDDEPIEHERLVIAARPGHTRVAVAVGKRRALAV